MDDVAIAGGGPAGAFAALLLARAGARVRVFERAHFPRPKLCGDTLNPGALAVLSRHVDLTTLLAQSDPIDGMLLTGPGGIQVTGRYGAGISGRAISRSALDQGLLARAVEAGATLEEGAIVKDATMADGRVAGVALAGVSGTRVGHPARLVIAADGRRSSIAFARGLARQPSQPRRWAIGGYFTDVDGMSTLGEMHVRSGHYLGVAPLPGGAINACVVVPHADGSPAIAEPGERLRRALDADPQLGPRFCRARMITEPMVLGPMAVDLTAAGEPGLLLAGDAAGFIDPMTGDGLRFALAGAKLAALTAIDVLTGDTPLDRAHVELAAKRRALFAAKWRFNRTLRSLVTAPAGVRGAAVAAAVVPSLFRGIIRYAGDCT